MPLIVVGAAGLGRGGPPPDPGGRARACRPPRSGSPPGYPPPGYRPRAAGAAAAGRQSAGLPGPARTAFRAPAPVPYVYPARLNGYLDPNLSRWMWLVKWFLAIPHYIVLFFLWFAFVVITIVAWFAILFTGPLPALAVQLQRRRDPLELAGGLLRLRGARHGPSTRRSPWPAPTTRRTSTSTIPSGSPAGWCW